MKRKADDLRADEASSNLSAFAALKAQKRDTIQEEASLVHSAVMHLERSGSELLQANEAELRELRGQQIIDTACALGQVLPVKLCFQAGLGHAAFSMLSRAVQLPGKSQKMSSYIDQLRIKWNCFCYIDLLPDSIMGCILDLGDVQTIVRCLSVCRRWRSLVLDLLNVNQPIHSSAATTFNRFTMLPEELIIHILGYADTNALVNCQAACKQLNRIISSSSKIWTNNAVVKGSLKEIGAQWMKLRRISGGGKMMALTLKCPRFDNAACFEPSTFRLFKQFPFQTLTEFSYLGHNGRCRVSSKPHLDQCVWSTITKCTNLKVLRFQANQPVRMIQLPLKGTPLAKCRLEVFQLVRQTLREVICKFDEAIFDLLGNAKVIHIDYVVNVEYLKKILEAAENTLEELHLGEFPQRGNLSDAHVTLRKLRSFSGLSPVPLDISAPQLTTFKFHSGGLKNFDRLLKTHYQNVRELSIKTIARAGNEQGDRVYDTILQHFLHLPHCCNVSIDLTTMAHAQDDYDFWDTFTYGIEVEDDDDEKIRYQILPHLERLTIKSFGINRADQLYSEDLLTFLETREELNLPRLHSLTLINCKRFSKLTIALIRRKVKHFYFE